MKSKVENYQIEAKILKFIKYLLLPIVVYVIFLIFKFLVK
jgi:hypothetical protein